jgi:hypothetical protein
MMGDDGRVRHNGWQETTERARALAAEAMAITGADPAQGEPPHGGLEVSWLAGAVDWLAEVAPSWEALTGEVATQRSYRQLFCAPALEVWLICWPRGGRLQLHDHGGASGAFEVVEGAIEERSLQFHPRAGHGRRAREGSRDRIVGPGEPIAFDGGYIHDVRNSGDAVATSVHAYGAAIRPMAFYRVDGGLVRTVGMGEQRSLLEAEIFAEALGDLVTGDLVAEGLVG